MLASWGLIYAWALGSVGPLAALSASFCWSGSFVALRLYGRRWPAAALNLTKNSVALVCLAISFLVLGAQGVHSVDAVWLVVSGVVGISLGDTALLMALSRLGAQLAAVSQCLSPPLAALFGVLILGERLSPTEWSGLGLTVFAVAGALWLSPQGRLHSPRHLWTGLFFGAVSAACNALAMVLARSALQHTDVVTGTFVRVAAGALFLAPWAFRGALPVWRGGSGGVAGVVFASFLGTYVGMLFMSVGAKYAKAALATGLSITYPIWVLPLAWLFLGERFTLLSLGSVALAIFGIVLMLGVW